MDSQISKKGVSEKTERCIGVRLVSRGSVGPTGAPLHHVRSVSCVALNHSFIPKYVSAIAIILTKRPQTTNGVLYS